MEIHCFLHVVNKHIWTVLVDLFKPQISSVGAITMPAFLSINPCHTPNQHGEV